MEEEWDERDTIYHSKGRRRDGDSGLRFHRWGASLAKGPRCRPEGGDWLEEGSPLRVRRRLVSNR
jgi:hypothetical protein